MTAGARRSLFDTLAAAGLDALLTEGHSIPAEIARGARETGLRLGGGIACYSDHAEAIMPIRDSLRPITPLGKLRPRMEWYRGIIPTDRRYEDALVRACRDAAERQPIDLFVLDFVRWPIHWELELREGASPIDSSFDPTTLRRFRDEMGVEIAVSDPAAAARAIHDELLETWTAFKCQVITELVARIVGEVRGVRPDLPVGAFVVPGDDATRRRYAGQDVGALAASLDLLLPMAYHAILRRTPSWVFEVVTDVRQRAPVPIVPVVQVTADAEVAGPNDWGDPFPAAHLGQAIDAGLAAGGHGFVVFPAHGLDAAALQLVSARTSGLTRRV
ncbi:MAG TPA: hypothetical protein VFO78_04750 [Candidatus Limnocylindrales bacterium]|nr:hypothetical protein [Candidatus Limnocylindrales bacterium]